MLDNNSTYSKKNNVFIANLLFKENKPLKITFVICNRKRKQERMLFFSFFLSDSEIQRVFQSVSVRFHSLGVCKEMDSYVQAEILSLL